MDESVDVGSIIMGNEKVFVRFLCINEEMFI